MAKLTDFLSISPVPMILSGNCRICDQSHFIPLNRQRSESIRQAWLNECLHESGDRVPVTNSRTDLIAPDPWKFAAAEMMRCIQFMTHKVFVA